MTTTPETLLPLPTDDPVLGDPAITLARVRDRWAPRARLAPMTGEEMRGADARAQRLGVSGEALMEQAGYAVAVAVRALLTTTGRQTGVVLVLCGPGNNGGDGLVAVRYLAGWGIRAAAVLVAGEERPSSPDARRAWNRLEGVAGAERIHAATAHEVALLLNGIDKAAVVVDALLGSGVSGLLREPVRTAVDLAVRARSLGVPIVAVDTPTALDLTSGEPSDPVVRADVTVTFHRPKKGHGSRVGRAIAGRVLVAPIGIPREADPT